MGIDFISSEIRDFVPNSGSFEKSSENAPNLVFWGEIPEFWLLGVFFKRKRQNFPENFPNFTFLKGFGDIFKAKSSKLSPKTPRILRL